MARSLTLRNIYDKKFKTLAFDSDWAKAFGQPEYNGIWLVYGVDKNGKTWFALMLADYLTKFDRVLYVSAEEGASKAFRDTCQRVGLDANNRRIHVTEYMAIEDLEARICKRKSQRIILIDNLTIYKDELKKGDIQRLAKEHPEKLFIYLAHEERNEPYTAMAKLARKLAKIIVNVKGLTCYISGRCPGGVMTIDENKAQLYWGSNIINNN